MIEIRNLHKVIGQQTVLEIPELTVAPGEIGAVTGPAGSGRQLLFELLTGKIRPSLGSVRIGEMDPAAQRDQLSRRIGILFEEDGLYERQSVIANLAFFCRLYNLPSNRAEEILEQIGLGDHASLPASKLPSGLKRRLAFGRAILHQPDVLILVEPFQRCDEVSFELLTRLIRQQASDETAILILADESTQLANLSDIFFRLERGQIVNAYRPKEIQAESAAFKVPVRMEGKVVLVNPAEILYADASDGKAVLYTPQGRLITQFTLTELENRLGRSGFFRTHRSFLVNLQHIKEVIPYTRNSFSLRLDDAQATVIPLSKQAAGELKDLLGY